MTFGTADRTIHGATPWYHADQRNRQRFLQLLAALVVGALLGLGAILVANFPDSWSQYAPFVLLALIFPFVAMMVGGVRKLLLAAVVFDIAFPIDFHLDYHTQEAAFGAIGGLEISLTTIALTVLYALWFAESLMRARSQPRPRNWLGPGVPLIAYVGFVALSMLAARDRTLSLFEVTMLLQTLLMFLYVVGTVRTREDVMFVVTLIMASLVLESILMALAPFGLRFKVGSLSNRVDITGGRVVASLFRTAGTVGSPILAASFVEMLLAPALSLLVVPVSPMLKRLAGMGLIMGSIALVLTFSRGGWIAAGLSSMAFSYLAWRKGRLSPTLPLAMVALALVMGIIFSGSVSARVFNEVSAYDRIPLAEIAYRVIRDHPVLGVGSNNIVVAEPGYQTPDLAGAWIYAIHDKYLLVWSETGIGALIAFFAFLLTTVRRGWQTWRMQDRLFSPIAVAFALGVVGEMIHMFVDVFNSRPQVQELWLVAALITAIYNLEKSPDAT